MKQADIERLLQMLVAEGEVSRAALKVLTTWPDPSRFEELFELEVKALLATADRSNPKEQHLAQLMEAARDRLLGRQSRNINLH